MAHLNKYDLAQTLYVHDIDKLQHLVDRTLSHSARRLYSQQHSQQHGFCDIKTVSSTEDCCIWLPAVWRHVQSSTCLLNTAENAQSTEWHTVSQILFPPQPQQSIERRCPTCCVHNSYVAWQLMH